MKIYAAIADKNLTVSVPVHVTNSITVQGTHKSIECFCGRYVTGEKALVDEAHRQHLTHHKEK